MKIPKTVDAAIDDKNIKYARSASNLVKAKAESKFWGSKRGVVNKLPSAMSDTLKKTVKFVTRKRNG